MVRVLPLTAAGRGFDARSVQTKDYTKCICCFSTKHATLKSKN